MKQNPDTNVMSTEMLSFEDIYNKTKNDIFFLAQLIGVDEKTTYSLYYSIYNKIYLSIPLPKNIKQLNELLDKIIINRSITILTSNENSLFFEEDEDSAESFDAEVEKIKDIPFELINKYINSEFITEVMAVFSRLPDPVRLCVALSCFKHTPLVRMAKYMGISVECVKHHLYKAHETFAVFAEEYFGKDSYSPFSFLPIVIQRAEQISSKKNPPPNLSITFTNAVNLNEQKVKQEEVEEFFKDEHTLDLLKEKPVELEHKTFLKFFSIIVGSIIALTILCNLGYITDFFYFGVFGVNRNYNITETSNTSEYSKYTEESSKEESSQEESSQEESSKEESITESTIEISPNGYCGDNATYTFTPDGTLTISGSGYMYNYEYNSSDYEVNCLPPWYGFADDIKTVIIDSDIESIGDMAFMELEHLKTVKIPNSVTYIGIAAFNLCPELKNINLPNSITTIEPLTFNGCRSLTNITIPNSVTSIGYGAFESCSSLKDIAIPDGVIYIGDGAFCQCYSFSTFTIPENVEETGCYILGECYNISSIKILADFSNFSLSTFNNCGNLESVILPDNIENINNNDYTQVYGNDVTLYCRKNSTTAKTLKKANIDFEYIN